MWLIEKQGVIPVLFCEVECVPYGDLISYVIVSLLVFGTHKSLGDFVSSKINLELLCKPWVVLTCTNLCVMGFWQVSVPQAENLCSLGLPNCVVARICALDWSGWAIHQVFRVIQWAVWFEVEGCQFDLSLADYSSNPASLGSLVRMFWIHPLFDRDCRNIKRRNIFKTI